MRRVTSNREYEITRASDGVQVARARVNWVYIDVKAGQPTRIPKEFEQNFEPALDHDEIEIVSWLSEMNEVRGAWIHEIYHATAGRLLARDYSLGLFVDWDGKLLVPPPDVVEKVIRGPKG